VSTIALPPFGGSNVRCGTPWPPSHAKAPWDETVSHAPPEAILTGEPSIGMAHAAGADWPGDTASTTNPRYRSD
jgi:hypothetical protein